VGEAANAAGSAGFATGIRTLAPPARWALVALTLAGALLRIAYQAGRAFSDDEAGSLLLLSMSYGELLTTFREPWLSMSVYLAMLKALSGAPLLRDWVMVAPSLVAGVAMIPLTAALALRLASPRTALVAAALVAANPYLLFYSVQLRSYILLAAFALASLLFFVDWRRSPSRRSAWGCSVCGTLAVLMHANGIYFGLFLAALAALWLFEEGWPSRERLRRAIGLALPVLAGAGVAALAYAPVAAEMARFRTKWSSVPPSSLAYLPDVYARYFGEGWLGLPTLACLLAGLWAAAQRNRPLAAMALGFAVPITAISWAGVAHFPWVHARYLIASLPILVLFVAAGVSWWTGRRGALACALLTAVVVASWTPEIRTLFAEKERYPWRTAATYLNHNLREGDVVVFPDVAQLHPQLILSLLVERATSFLPVSTYLSARGDPPGRLVVVNPHTPIESDAEQVRLGEIQILVYDQTPRVAAARAFLADLERSVGERVSGELAGQYRLILDLRAALSPETDVPSEYTARYYSCLVRTELQRNLLFLNRRGRR